jgi:hypothetical protein
VRRLLHPALTRRYPTNDRMLTDTLIAGTVSNVATSMHKSMTLSLGGHVSIP